MKKKIYVIGSAGVPARYGGFETFAENFSLKYAKKNELTVFCSKKYYQKSERANSWNSIRRVFLPVNANGMQSIIYDLLSMIRSFRVADIIILLGSGAAIFLPLFSKSFRRKLWLHVDGMEWKRSKWNYFIRQYLYLSYQVGIRNSGKIIIDNASLLDFIPAHFHTKVVLSGYGGDHLPKIVNVNTHSHDSFALVIARAEPENNLELILKCFAEDGSIPLVVIANWYQTRLGRQLKREYSNFDLISLIGPIFNEPAKLQTFRTHCSLYIHGHSAGGTNPSLVEAMYAGVPVFAFDNNFNRNTTNNLAYYFNSEAKLLNLIQTRKSLKLNESAGKLYKYAKENHTWERAFREFKL